MMELVSSPFMSTGEDIDNALREMYGSLENSNKNIKKQEELLLKLGRTLAEKINLNCFALLLKILVHFLLPLEPQKIAEGDANTKINLCLECIQWAKEQSCIYLRQNLQARLVRLYNDVGQYVNASNLATDLIHELKRIDDKDLIIDVQLENSKAFYNLSFMSKARTVLVAARTTAKSIYVSPRMQASLDMQSGMVHAGDDCDFKTAFSYFFEAFEGFDSVNDKDEALRAFKYMLLCQIMLGNFDELKSLMMHKNAMKYTSKQLDAMVLIAEAAKKRSMSNFNSAFGRYRDELENDITTRKYFNMLRSTMLEKDLCRLIEPYSQVQIACIASLIGMDEDKVERKLSQMILDKKFSGSLNQGEGLLVVYEALAANQKYEVGVEIIRAVNEAMDTLHAKTASIHL